jgi:alpha-tubulin suppressor-like RCC1 family protein
MAGASQLASAVGAAGVAPSISAGTFYTCALFGNGQISCWGQNSYGQLGLGDTVDRSGPGPTIAFPTGVAAKEIAVGNEHTCSLTTIGRVMCWGRNNVGQLGTANTADLMAPGPVTAMPGGATAKAIAIGSQHSCALLTTGRVTCWGDNSFGQLGLGTTSNLNAPGPLVALPGGATAKAITTGNAHSCALLSTGDITCWGYNGAGGLGTGNNTDLHAPGPPIVMPGVAKAAAIAANNAHTCALLSTGQVTCWGDNQSGQLGTGYTGNSSNGGSGGDLHAPGPVLALPGGARAKAIAAGGLHVCALLTTGQITCWGEDTMGELGDGGVAGRGAPSTLVSLPTGATAGAITGGYLHSCAMLSTGEVKCWGYNGYGQLGISNPSILGTPGPAIAFPAGAVAGAAKIAAGGLRSCALLVSGQISCWGLNHYGQLGTGNTTDLSVPSPAISLPGGNAATAIDLGDAHSCALLGTGQVTCWGFNASGQLGTGNTAHRSTPSPAIALPIAASAISVSGGHSCALLGTGQVTCWGYNPFGELGTGDTLERHAPGAMVAMPGGATPTAIVVGEHSCALLDTGQVTCWGYNTYGELGTGNTAHLTSPGPVVPLPGGATATAIAVGDNHTCALLGTGQITCWGYNVDGQLGTGNTTDLSSPGPLVPLPGGATAIAVAAHGYQTCALLSIGQVTCWGYNELGALGTGNTTNFFTPGPIVPLPGGATARAITAGYRHTCALLSTGQVACWGYNGLGQAGTGNIAIVGAPAVAGVPKVTVAIAAGQRSPGAAPARFTIAFDQNVTSFDSADVVVSGTAGATIATVTGGPQIYTATVSNVPGSGLVTVSIPARAATGILNQPNTAAPTSATVIVDALPAIAPHADVSALVAPNATTATVSYTNPNATDDKGTPTVVCTPASGSVFAVGSTPVTCTATDAIGQTATSVFSIVVSPNPVSAAGRLLDTRPAGSTVDGASAAGGTRPADSVLEIVVAGRGGISASAREVVMNVTAVGPATSGYLTVFPCGSRQPNASNLNFDAGMTVPNLVVTSIGKDGKICVYTSAATELIVDVSEQFPRGQVVASNPSRLTDTRPGSQTVDDRAQGEGIRAAGSVTAVQVTGRSGVPANAGVAILNVTVTGTVGPGYVTVFPCDSPPPNASSLNYSADSTVANLVVSKLSSNGTVCVYTDAATHLIVDFAGYFNPRQSSYVPIAPARLGDTRVGAVTIDGRSQGAGFSAAGSTTEVMVAGRGIVAPSATNAMLNITVTAPESTGFVTVYPCGTTRPDTSNVNFAADQTVANGALTALGTNGTVCVYTSTATDVIIDINGYQRI